MTYLGCRQKVLSRPSVCSALVSSPAVAVTMVDLISLFATRHPEGSFLTLRPYMFACMAFCGAFKTSTLLRPLLRTA